MMKSIFPWLETVSTVYLMPSLFTECLQTQNKPLFFYVTKLIVCVMAALVMPCTFTNHHSHHHTFITLLKSQQMLFKHWMWFFGGSYHI